MISMPGWKVINMEIQSRQQNQSYSRKHSQITFHNFKRNYPHLLSQTSTNRQFKITATYKLLAHQSQPNFQKSTHLWCECFLKEGYFRLIWIILMWSQFLNESRSQKKFDNRPVVILGSKHSGKRSLVDSLIDISKTTLYGKRLQSGEGNKMRLKGLTTAIDYAYLNVLDSTDPDNRTHAKLEVYMVEEIEHPSIYSQLASPALLKSAVFVIMLDFTAPWNFVQEIEKWVRFIYDLQQMAQLSIADLEEMATKTTCRYKQFREPEFDENGKLRLRLGFDKEQQEEQLSLPLPEGVLVQNIRVPLLVCVNKCDLQSQVLREESTSKILLILYHLRTLCVKYGAALIYTSIRNSCNIALLYEYIIHTAYGFPFKFRSEPLNEEAIFIPLGYDKPALIQDSVVKLDLSRSFNEVIPFPAAKRNLKEELIVEEDSKFFEKYINQSQSTATTTSVISEKEAEKPQQRKQAEVTDFFKNLLQGGGSRPAATRTQQQSQRLLNAEKELMKHTTQVLQKKGQEQ